MAKKPAQIPTNLQPWIEARRKFHLSHAHVQMARELGMNPNQPRRTGPKKIPIHRNDLIGHIARLKSTKTLENGHFLVRWLQKSARQVAQW